MVGFALLRFPHSFVMFRVIAWIVLGMKAGKRSTKTHETSRNFSCHDLSDQTLGNTFSNSTIERGRETGPRQHLNKLASVAKFGTAYCS